MAEQEQSQIVRYVNTFTAGEWQSRKPNERIRRGISITKSNPQSADKFAQLGRQKAVQQNPINDENQNTSNIHAINSPDPTSPHYLLERIRNLQLEVAALEKQKIDLEKRMEEKEQKQPMENFVESHYIACKEDMDDILDERRRLTQAISNLEAENNFLKLNIGLQEQYIIKVQGELDLLRTKPNQSIKSQLSEYSIQTDSIPKMDAEKVEKVDKIDKFAQTQSYQLPNEYEELNKLAQRFQEQTNEFSALIQKLQQDNSLLLQQNQALNQQLSAICELTKESEEINQREKSQWKAKVEGLQQELSVKQTQRYQLIRIHQSEIRGKISEYEEIIKQKQKQLIKERQRKVLPPSSVMDTKEARLQKEILQLREGNHEASKEQKKMQSQLQQVKKQLIDKQSQMQKFLNHTKEKETLEMMINDEKSKNKSLKEQIISLKQQLDSFMRSEKEKEVHLKVQYSSYKQQIDGLLLYLEQKNEALKQKQVQICQQLQSQQLLYLKNQETLRKQTEIQALISDYQSQIKRIQNSLQEYVSELLLHKQQEKDAEIKELKNRHIAEQASNHQEISYLLNKIDSLQQELSQVRAENKRMQRIYHTQMAKLEEREAIISNLRSDLIQLSNKYESQVALRSKCTQQRYIIAQKLAEEETLMDTVRNELQRVKAHYDGQIVSMQHTITQLQGQLRYLEQENMHSKQAFELRLVEVKKDYDILYAKYLKYKTLSIHLQNSQNH